MRRYWDAVLAAGCPSSPTYLPAVLPSTPSCLPAAPLLMRRYWDAVLAAGCPSPTYLPAVPLLLMRRRWDAVLDPSTPQAFPNGGAEQFGWAIQQLAEWLLPHVAWMDRALANATA